MACTSFLLSFWVLFSIIDFIVSDAKTRERFLHDLSDVLDNKTRYDKSRYPPTPPKTPIQVNVSLILYDLRDFSEVQMNYRTDIYFIEIWNDVRFVLNDDYLTLGYSTLHPDVINLIWKPDTFFPNVMESIDASDAESFTHRTVLKISGKGDVCYSQRLTLTPNCPMKLKRFPFDFQLCKLLLRSYAITDNYLVYTWDKQDPVTIINEFMLPELKLYNYSLASHTLTLPGSQNFSGLNLCFLLERKTNFYFMQLYIPGALIIFVAWLSSMSEYRFQNLLSVLLAQFFLYFSYITVMPKVSEVKLMDIFLATCFVFIFIAMVKTFLVEDKKPSANAEVAHDMKLFRSSMANVKKQKEIANARDQRSMLKKLYYSFASHHYCVGRNRIIFIAYPASFALFCIFYFTACFCFLHDPIQADTCGE